MKDKSKIYRKLLDKAEKETRSHTKFLKTMMHGVAKEIAREIKANIKNISALQTDKTSPNFVSVVVKTKSAVAEDAITAIRQSLTKFGHNFILNSAMESPGFVISWNIQPRI